MARKQQQLINYHSSGKTSVPAVADLHYGEIAIRHHVDDPTIFVKVSESELAEFKSKSYIDKEIESVESKITSLSGASTSAVTELENYVKETYWTSATTQNKIKEAKDAAVTSAYTASTAYTKTVSGNIETAIGVVERNLEGEIEEVTTALSTYKTEVANTYEKKDDATTKYNNATAYTDTKYNEATAYTNTVSGYIESALNDYERDLDETISQLQQKDTQLSDRIDTLSGTHITSANVVTAISTAKSDLIGTSTDTATANTIYGAKAKAVDEATARANAVLGTTADTKNDTTVYGVKALAESNYDALDERITTEKGNLEDYVEEASGNILSYVNDKLTSALHYKGTKNTVADLPSTGETGDVWNVVAANGTVDEPGYTPAGTNYAWDGTKWDALGGTVDLSIYATKQDLNTAKSELQTSIGQLTTNLSTLESNVENTYETKSDATTKYNNATAYTDSQIETLRSEIGGDVDSELSALTSALNAEITARTQGDETLQGYIDTINGSDSTNGSIKKALKDAKSYADTQDAALKTTLEGNSASTSGSTTIEGAKKYADQVALNAKNDAIAAAGASANTLNSAIETEESQRQNADSQLGTALSAVSATTVTAVQNVTVDNTTVNNITATKDSETNIVALNFDSMIIDCGDF